MEFLAVVIVTALFTAGSIAVGFGVWQMLLLKKALLLQMSNIEKLVGFIAKGHQLATILEIKGVALGVNTEQFEANKSELLTQIKKQMTQCKHEQPSTWAFVVIHYSGLEVFLARDTGTRLQEALSRLRANNDMAGAEALMQDVVEQLAAPEKLVADTRIGVRPEDFDR